MLQTDLLPREKLKKYGPDSLTNGELLAIIFNTGYKGEKVLELSQRILKEYGSDAICAQKSVENAMKTLKIPLQKACQLIACAEIGRRLFEVSKNEFYMSNPKNVFLYLQNMQTLKQEHMRGIYINSKNRLIKDEVISIGNVQSCMLHIPDIFRTAIEYGLPSFILAHNHPSGDPNPSEEDIVFTQKVLEACSFMDIACVDHIIIGNGTFFSFKERGLL